jgi:hypothetical protein
MNIKTATYYAAKTVVLGFAGMALSISCTHVYQLAVRTGVAGWHSYVAPAFVDGMMLLGRLGQCKAFEETTRRAGRWVFAIGVILSFAANILAGETLGERVFGAMVVGGFAFGEWYAGKLKPAPKTTPTVTPEEQAAIELAEKRHAAALKGVETKRLNKATETAAPAKPRARKAPAARTAAEQAARDERAATRKARAAERAAQRGETTTADKAIADAQALIADMQAITAELDFDAELAAIVAGN